MQASDYISELFSGHLAAFFLSGVLHKRIVNNTNLATSEDLCLRRSDCEICACVSRILQRGAIREEISCSVQRHDLTDQICGYN